ncbi:MAG: tetratricopeptide repeat protein [Alphaproteobacteria bacterium]
MTMTQSATDPHTGASAQPVTAPLGAPGLEAPQRAVAGLDSGALQRLQARFRSLQGGQKQAAVRRKANRLVQKFFRTFSKGDHRAAALLALDAIEADRQYGLAHHCMGLALEKLGELHKALGFFEKALELDPQDPDIYYNLGNTAWRLEMLEGAAKLFRVYIEMEPDKSQGYNNLAGVMRDQGLFDEALETVRAGIYMHAENPHLWNTLGTVLLERGDAEACHTFFDEALRLDPDFGLALHNKAFAAFNTGDFDTAVTLWRRAETLFAHDRHRLAEVGHSIGHCLLAKGDLVPGWEAWTWRHDPAYRGSTLFHLPAPRWQGEPLAGRRILAIAEQGIGDEIMFANALPDLIDAVGPDGQVVVAVERRLVSLFQRALPGVTVGPLRVSRHNGKLVRSVPWLGPGMHFDFYTPFGDCIGAFRPRVEDFPPDRTVLTADPEAVAAWRTRLAGLGSGPKMGVCWRSGHITVARSKFYCPLEHWQPVFTTPDVVWINLQYDDCAEDMKQIRSRFGAQIHDFPDLDLRNDLDGNAALCAALDLVVSAPTAAGGLAAGVGTPTWFLSNRTMWPTLGTDHYPWYPRTRFFAPDAFADWPSLMARLGKELQTFAAVRDAA